MSTPPPPPPPPSTGPREHVLAFNRRKAWGIALVECTYYVVQSLLENDCQWSAETVAGARQFLRDPGPMEPDDPDDPYPLWGGNTTSMSHRGDHVVLTHDYTPDTAVLSLHEMDWALATYEEWLRAPFKGRRVYPN